MLLGSAYMSPSHVCVHVRGLGLRMTCIYFLSCINRPGFAVRIPISIYLLLLVIYSLSTAASACLSTALIRVFYCNFIYTFSITSPRPTRIGASQSHTDVIDEAIGSYLADNIFCHRARCSACWISPTIERMNQHDWCYRICLSCPITSSRIMLSPAISPPLSATIGIYIKLSKRLDNPFATLMG